MHFWFSFFTREFSVFLFNQHTYSLFVLYYDNWQWRGHLEVTLFVIRLFFCLGYIIRLYITSLMFIFLLLITYLSADDRFLKIIYISAGSAGFLPRTALFSPGYPTLAAQLLYCLVVVALLLLLFLLCVCVVCVSFVWVYVFVSISFKSIILSCKAMEHALRKQLWQS